MSYVLDPIDEMYYWDGQGNINDIPVEAVGKVKPSPVSDLSKIGENIFQRLASGEGVTPTAQDFDVYWNTGKSEYQGSQFVSGETPRSFASIEQEFKKVILKYYE